jgi:hypothetical protein
MWTEVVMAYFMVSQNLLEGLLETIKNFSKDTQLLCRDLNLVHPEAGV